MSRNNLYRVNHTIYKSSDIFTLRRNLRKRERYCVCLQKYFYTLRILPPILLKKRYTIFSTIALEKCMEEVLYTY